MVSRRVTIPITHRHHYEVLERDLTLVMSLVRECGFSHKRMAAVLWEAKDGKPRDGRRMKTKEVRYYHAVARKAYKTLGYNITDFRNADTEESRERLALCLKSFWGSSGRISATRRKVQG